MGLQIASVSRVSYSNKKKKNVFSMSFSLSFAECDRSCDGCTGDGPDLCEKCAEGYELRDGICSGKILCNLLPSLCLSPHSICFISIFFGCPKCEIHNFCSLLFSSSFFAFRFVS